MFGDSMAAGLFTQPPPAATLSDAELPHPCYTPYAFPCYAASATLSSDADLPELFRGRLVTDRLLPQWGTHQVGGMGSWVAGFSTGQSEGLGGCRLLSCIAAV